MQEVGKISLPIHAFLYKVGRESPRWLVCSEPGIGLIIELAVIPVRCRHHTSTPDSISFCKQAVRRTLYHSRTPWPARRKRPRQRPTMERIAASVSIEGLNCVKTGHPAYLLRASALCIPSRNLYINAGLMLMLLGSTDFPTSFTSRQCFEASRCRQIIYSWFTMALTCC